MSTLRKVHLVGGRHDGRTTEVRYGQRLKVIESEDEEWVRAASDDLVTGWLPLRRVRLDTYRQTEDPFVFEVCETPTAHEDTRRILEEDDW